jgi:cytochrome bd-type quinol oxidase subunit 2
MTAQTERTFSRMATVFNVLTAVFMVAVVIVLMRGLWNMMRGGSGNTSNKMMQLRVLLQFIAIIMVVLAVYFARPG